MTLLTLLQTPDFAHYLDRFGLPIAFIVVLLFVGWKVVWPFIAKQDERLQQQHTAMLSMMENQLNEARTARSTEMQMFKSTLDTGLAQNTAAVREAVDAIRQISRSNRNSA